MGAPVIELSGWRALLENGERVDQYTGMANDWDQCVIGEARARCKEKGIVLNERCWPSRRTLGDPGLVELAHDFPLAIEKNDRETALDLLFAVEDRVTWLVKRAAEGHRPCAGSGV